MADFTEQVVMITGGTGNLGSATARAFAADGSHIVLVDRSPEKQAALFPDWVNSSEHWLAAPVDVTDPAAASRVAAETIKRFGRLDVLVNTVGGFRAGQTVQELDLATWDLMLHANARSMLVMTQAVIPHMVGLGGGKIVNVAARAALNAPAKQSAYAASKAAVVRLTESLAAELKDQGINVNCVLPKIIDTPENREAMPKADPSKWVTPDSLAAVIQFLASPAARDIHGAALPVDGLA